jgi:hypothetical protein
MDTFYAASMAHSLLVPFISVLAALPVVLYVVARWRTTREGEAPDPQLGLKVALSFFRLLATQVVLVGLFLLVYALITDTSESTQESLMRAAAGLLLPGALILAAHVAAMTHTNHDEHPIVGHLFGGVNLILTGLVGFGAVTAALFLICQKGVNDELERMVWSMVLVYVLAWAGQSLLFSRAARALSTKPPV